MKNISKKKIIGCLGAIIASTTPIISAVSMNANVSASDMTKQKLSSNKLASINEKTLFKEHLVSFEKVYAKDNPKYNYKNNDANYLRSKKIFSTTYKKFMSYVKGKTLNNDLALKFMQDNNISTSSFEKIKNEYGVGIKLKRIRRIVGYPNPLRDFCACIEEENKETSKPEYVKESRIGDIKIARDKENTYYEATRKTTKNTKEEYVPFVSGFLQDVKDYSSDLKFLLIKSATIAAAAYAAGVAFSAASFFTFGAMVPFATASFTQAAWYTAKAIVISSLKKEWDIQVLRWGIKKLANDTKRLSLVLLIFKMRKAYKAMKALKTVSLATAWANPIISVAIILIDELTNVTYKLMNS